MEATLLFAAAAASTLLSATLAFAQPAGYTGAAPQPDPPPRAQLKRARWTGLEGQKITHVSNAIGSV